jgi:hypothetical protein
MSYEIERTQTVLVREHSPDIEVSTLQGEYILRVGGMEIARWEAGDRATAKIVQGWIQRKLSLALSIERLRQPGNIKIISH